MADENEVIRDRANGELSADPAAEAGASNPCPLPAPPDDCADPIDINVEIDHPKKFTWELRLVDRKHTRMAARTHQQLLDFAAAHDQKPPGSQCGTLPQACEQEFCREVDGNNNTYGSQIPSETREDSVYTELVEEAIRQKFKKPPSGGGKFDLDADASEDVGFDVEKGKRMTKHYKVHGTFSKTGPKARGDAHLFPKAP